jgi:hypothetical protein
VFNALKALNSFLGALVSLVLLALLAGACWWGISTYLGVQKDREQIAGLKQELDAKQRELEAKQREIVRLGTALRLLKIDHRIAQIDVVSQQGSEKDKTLVTTFNFVEVDDKGIPLTAPRRLTVQGDMAYVEYRVVKFSDENVEAGDPLRGTSICSFRRIFGEHQNPAEGFVLDPVGSRPAGYQDGREMSVFEKEIWAQFWELANNPAKAQEKGIRAAHGEAPNQKLVPGKRYKVELRASGGLTFKTEDLPKQPPGPSS